MIEEQRRLSEKRIEAVIFDLDDTLIDWSGGPNFWRDVTVPCLRRVYQFLQQRGRQLPDEETYLEQIRLHFKRTWDEARVSLDALALGNILHTGLAELQCDLGDIDIDDVLRAYEWGPVEGVAPYPDTIPMLKKLRQRGYKIGLVTNSSMPMWMRDVELEAFGLLEFLDARITSGDSRYIKPHPAIYERILRLLEAEPEQAVFVGDSPEHDIAGANEAGLISVLIDPPHLSRPRNGVVPDFTINRPSQLLPILDQLEKEGG